MVNICDIPHRVLFNGIPLRGLPLILIYSTLNLRTHWFTVDFVLTFCTPNTMHILMRISQHKMFSSIKNQITLRCFSLCTVVGVAASNGKIGFNLLFLLLFYWKTRFCKVLPAPELLLYVLLVPANKILLYWHYKNITYLATWLLTHCGGGLWIQY